MVNVRASRHRNPGAVVKSRASRRSKRTMKCPSMLFGFLILWVGLSGAELPMSGSVFGAQVDQDSIGPDVIIADIHSTVSYGFVDQISAFSLGNTLCNPGDEPISYISFTSQHPITGQQMYRLSDDRFEQIGVSWVEHRFFALQGTACGFGCQPSDTGTFLGAGCSDPSSAAIGGHQFGLSPRSGVNVFTGSFVPERISCDDCTLLDRRLQVLNVDLDPALNADALYFAEVQVIAPDDAAAGNGESNASYRRILIGIDNGMNDASDPCLGVFGTEQGEYCVKLSDQYLTQRRDPAIRAWRDQDPTVVEAELRVPGEGLFILAAKSIDLGNGFWDYEYAIQNINSDRAAGSFSIPIEVHASADSFGFHDVDYHSGDPYDGTDWTAVRTETEITWSTVPYDIDTDANALRWGTLYNFRFRSRFPPGETEATLGLFKPGEPQEVTALTIGPTMGDCDLDGVDDSDDLCPCTSARDACRCPDTGVCCWPGGLCEAGFPANLCLAKGGRAECFIGLCAGGCSLSEIDGDVDRDGDRDMADVARFYACFAGEQKDIPSVECRARFDFDLNGDISLADFAMLQRSYSGP